MFVNALGQFESATPYRNIKNIAYAILLFYLNFSSYNIIHYLITFNFGIPRT